MGTSVVRFKRENEDKLQWGIIENDQVHPLAINALDHTDLMNCYFKDKSAFNKAKSKDAINQQDLNFV